MITLFAVQIDQGSGQLPTAAHGRAATTVVEMFEDRIAGGLGTEAVDGQIGIDRFTEAIGFKAVEGIVEHVCVFVQTLQNLDGDLAVDERRGGHMRGLW